MALSRRDFLAASAVIGAGLPGVFRKVAQAAPDLGQPGAKDTVLVVVQLTGGNDGLNTVIPYQNPAYLGARPTLRQPAEKVLKIAGELAFHPELGGLSSLLEAGSLGIVQGVGYPNPNRSHFESMDIWHKATPSSQQRYGWLARATAAASIGALHAADASPPLALYGTTGYAPSLKSLSDYKLRTASDSEESRKTIEGFAAKQSADSDLLGFVRSSAREAYQSAERMRVAAAEYKTSVTYAETPLAQRMKLFAQLIDAGIPERVFYTSLEGFDTHAGQAIGHGSLLKTVGDAMNSFHQDLKAHGHQKRVITMAFSEFGRRVHENGSQGTDHGTAAPLFLAGESVRQGLIGEHPSLEKLDEGDLRFAVDFRGVYAAILDRWLGIPSQEILGEKFTAPELFA
jgi:uncharacterized protein (DUF1501 family)